MNSISRYLHRRGIRCGSCGHWGSRHTIKLTLKYKMDDKCVKMKSYYAKRLRNVCLGCGHIMSSKFIGTNE